MPTLDRYLLREVLVPLVVGLGLFFVVVAFAQVLKVSDSVTGLGITGSDVVIALIYSLPPLLGLLLPVSGLFATLLAVGRLAADNEIVALSAAGVSPYRLVRVPIAIGLVLALASGMSLAVGEPWGIRGLRSLMAYGAQRALASGVQVGEFNQWVPGVTFYAQGKKGKKLRDVVFADRRDNERPIVITARRGIVKTGERARDIVFDLEDGAILLHDKEADAYRVIHFEKSHYRLDVGGLVGKKARTMSSVQEKDLATLWRESHEERSRNKRAQLTITLHRKLALPLATIIFMLVAVPLGARASGGARARSFLYSAAIVGAYYYIGRAAELSARKGGFDPVLAAWLPNLLGIAAAALLLMRLPRRAA